MNTNEQELLNRIERLEKANELLLEALEAVLSPSQVHEVQEVLNPSPKLTEAQQEAQDVALLKAHYGVTRYEAEWANKSVEDKRIESWRVFG